MENPMKPFDDIQDPHDLTGSAQLVEQDIAALEQRAQAGEALALAGSERIGDAIEDLRTSAEREAFPDTLSPVGEAVLRDFALWRENVGLLPYERIEGALAALHEQCIDRYQDLAALIRSPRGVRMVALHAQNSVAGDSDVWETTQLQALAEFRRLIAAQLHRRNVCEPAAGLLVVVLPQLTERLAAIEGQLLDRR